MAFVRRASLDTADSSSLDAESCADSSVSLDDYPQFEVPRGTSLPAWLAWCDRHPLISIVSACLAFFAGCFALLIAWSA